MEKKNQMESRNPYFQPSLVHKEMESLKESLVSGSSAIRNIYNIDNFGLWSLIQSRLFFQCERKDLRKMESMIRQLFFLDAASTTLMHALITTSMFQAKKYIIVKNDDHALKLLDGLYNPIVISEGASRFYIALTEDEEEEVVYINVWITGKK